MYYFIFMSSRFNSKGKRKMGANRLNAGSKGMLQLCVAVSTGVVLLSNSGTWYYVLNYKSEYVFSYLPNYIR